MKSENFVIIQGWMCNELGLKGNDLLVYALIYGFSQDGESKFSGSRNYIANTFNISKPTVDKAIQNLLDKQYIIKHISGDITEPNTYWANLEVVKKLYWGSKETLLRGSKETLLNNTSKQTIEDKKNNSKELLQNQEFSFGKSKTKKDNLYTKCVQLIDSYPFDNEIRNLLIEYLQFRLSIKDKPLYNNMWKGMLSKLRELTDDHGYTDDKLCKAIIKQSIERGYLSFYPIGSYNGVKNESGSRNVPRMTEEDYKKEAEHLAELEAQGVQVRF